MAHNVVWTTVFSWLIHGPYIMLYPQNYSNKLIGSEIIHPPTLRGPGSKRISAGGSNDLVELVHLPP